MADEPKPISAPRCLGCGAWHPFISPCPYVKRQSVRFEVLGKQRLEIVETEFFDERMTLTKHSLQTEAEVQEALKEAEPAVTQG